MEGYSKCPQLLDLIPKEKEWFVRRAEEKTRSHGFSEEKKLELSLGPPGGEWGVTHDDSSREREHESLLSLGYSSINARIQNKGLELSPWPKHQTAMMKETSLPCNMRIELQNAEKKGFSTTASSAQKRNAPAPVVGWPPIRSFRKNIASGSYSKLSSESPEEGPTKDSGGPKPAAKSIFVKINMDGIPIGRKVDLKTYDSYDKLSCAVDELFRDLLAAQSDTCAGTTKDKKDERKAIACLSNGSGDYTLVYEDNEGDRMLVGDVPWHMFVSTVKRLRVLKSSELPALSRGSK